jgi:hypothetical protein
MPREIGTTVYLRISAEYVGFWPKTFVFSGDYAESGSGLQYS